MFLWALAKTSNGPKAGLNFKMTEEVYRSWKTTSVLPSDADIGSAKASIDKGLALYNTLRAKMNDERLFAFMATEFEVGQIGRMLGEKPGGEGMPTQVLCSAVLGPKIGNGFFSNRQRRDGAHRLMVALQPSATGTRRLRPSTLPWRRV